MCCEARKKQQNTTHNTNRKQKKKKITEDTYPHIMSTAPAYFNTFIYIYD